VPVKLRVEFKYPQRTVVLLSVIVEEMATRQILVLLGPNRSVRWIVRLPTIRKACLLTIEDTVEWLVGSRRDRGEEEADSFASPGPFELTSATSAPDSRPRR
jgi:hypothetical protein